MKLPKPKPLTGKEITSRFKSQLASGITTAEISDLLQAMGWMQGMLSIRVAASGIPTADVLAIGARARDQFDKGQSDMQDALLRSKRSGQ